MGIGAFNARKIQMGVLRFVRRHHATFHADRSATKMGVIVKKTKSSRTNLHFRGLVSDSWEIIVASNGLLTVIGRRRQIKGRIINQVIRWFCNLSSLSYDVLWVNLEGFVVRKDEKLFIIIVLRMLCFHLQMKGSARLSYQRTITVVSDL